MSIRTGTAITASDLTSLKNKILTMYGKRTVNVSGQQLSSTTQTQHKAVSDSSFTKGNKIDGSPGLGALINACLVINDIPNLLWTSNGSTAYLQDPGGKAFGNGSTTEILSGWLTNAKRDASTTSTNHGCRGACVGICTDACTSTCHFECTASSVGTVADVGTNPSVGTQVGTNCTGSSCSGQCKGQCKTVCYWQCKSGCMSGCKGTCWGCSGCYTACNTGCRGNGNIGIEPQ